MVCVLDVQTRPYYGQVALFDPTVEGSYPDWDSGELEAVGGESGLAVATRADHLGFASIEVWLGRDSEDRGFRAVLESTIAVAGNGVLVGSVTGNDLHLVAIPPGRHRVQVLVSGPRDGVDRVSFEFTDLGMSA